MKLLCGMMALACAPVALAGNGAAIPKEKVAEFVAERLDVQRFPLQFGRNRRRAKRPLAIMVM